MAPIGQRLRRVDDAQLRGIVVRGMNGTAFELSSAFRSDTADYGVAVPQSFANGSLCLQPTHGKGYSLLYCGVQC